MDSSNVLWMQKMRCDMTENEGDQLLRKNLSKGCLSKKFKEVCQCALCSGHLL